jgi:hypothetical protein
LHFCKRDITRLKSITLIYTKTPLANNKQEIGYLIFKGLDSLMLLLYILSKIKDILICLFQVIRVMLLVIL